MTTTYLEIGPCPCDEDAAQCGIDPDFKAKNIAECNRFKELLEEQFEGHPNYTRFFVKNFPHEFGTYREVCVEFDDDDEDSANFAFGVEQTAPTTWA